MEYEKIVDEHGNFEGIKILSTGKVIKCRTVADLGNNSSIEIDDDTLELFDASSKTLFKITYYEYGQIENLASIAVEADNYKTNEMVSCEIVQGVDKVKAFTDGISVSTDILENENIEDYTNMLMGVFNRANYINENPLFQSWKSIIIQFTQEQITKAVNYKFDNATRVSKLIEVEKGNLESQIDRINSQILSYNNVVAQIQPSDKKM